MQGELPELCDGHAEQSAWAVVITQDGTPTLRHPGHGECCHSLAGAWTQAQQRYVAACCIAAKAAARPDEPLRLLDIGTGIGLNLAAAWSALEATQCTLIAHSFEREAAVLERAEELSSYLPEAVRRWHAPIARSLRAPPSGTGRQHLEPPTGGAPLELTLHLGDARELIHRLPLTPGFDAVFLDPFSPRVEPELWQFPFLRAIRQRMAPGSWLATYSASLGVRAALAATGLQVGRGAAVGWKREGTLASPNLSPPALEERTAGRVARRAAGLDTSGARS